MGYSRISTERIRELLDTEVDDCIVNKINDESFTLATTDNPPGKTKKGDTTMAARKNEAKSKFPAAPVYDIKIPRGLPKLDGTLTRKERVAVAMDVLALLRLRSRSRKIVLVSCYFDADSVPESGQLHSTVLKGECAVCARGILFLASVDRFDRCDLAKFGDCLDSEAVNRTAAEWGIAQAGLIEGTFENGQMGTWSDRARQFYVRHIVDADRRPLMRAIAQNIIDNNGEFVP